MKRLPLTLIIVAFLLLMLACQHQKQNNFTQNPALHKKIEAYTNAFRDSITSNNCDYVITNGTILLRQISDSLNYDSIGWAMIHHRLGTAYRNAAQGKLLQNKDFYQKMDEHYRCATQIRSKFFNGQADLANSYLNWSIGENNIGNYQDALIHLAATLPFFDKEKPLQYIAVRKELLKAYAAKGDNDFVKKYFENIQQFFESLDSPDFSIMQEYAASLTYYSHFLNENSKHEQAITYLKKSISIYENLNLLDDANQQRYQYSFSLMKNGAFNQAISETQKTILYFNHQKDTTRLTQSYLQLGNCYHIQKKYTEAISIYQTIALPNLLKEGNKKNIGDCFYNIAYAYSGLKKYDVALVNYQNTLNHYLPDFDKKEIHQNPNDESIKKSCLKLSLIAIFEEKAQNQYKLYQQTNITSDLENTWRTYQTLNSLFGYIREDILSENSKIDLGKKQNWVADALNVAKQLFAQTNNLKYQEEAYALVQNTKAQVINEHFQGEKGKKIANVSKEDSDKERELYAECSNLDKKQLDNPNDKSFSEKILLAKQRFYDFQKVIENKYPLYRQSKYDYKALTVKERQERLKPNMAVLDYMVTKDSLHIFCINKQRLTWKTISLDGSQKANADTLRKLLNDPNSKMKTPQSKQFLDCSHRLYQSLVQPIANELLGVTRLRIISDDWIYKVSFQSLCTKPYSGDWSDIGVPYLIRNFAISHLFSVKELKPIAPKQSNSKISVGSFGINYNDDKIFSSSRSSDSCLRIMAATRGGGKLYHAAEEANSVYALWGIGDCLLNDKATKNNFIKNCQSKDYSILHLAMHGIPECDNPEKIQLIFAKNSATEDNLMHLHEIAGLKMHSDLAVISACHSGDGQLENKEGIISLGRAFAMAGCRSLITSNSYVNDYTSPMIFKYFYNNLKDNDLEKDIALQKAICSYLDDKNDMMRLPYRWANFHLWGDVDSIKTSEKESFFSFNWLMTLLGISGIGLFLWLGIYKRMKR